MTEVSTLPEPGRAWAARALVRVLRSIAEALNVSAETLFEHAGLVSNTDKEPDDESTVKAICADERPPSRNAVRC